MSVLVTGAGLIGCQVARLFVEAGEGVVLYDINPQIDVISELVDVSGLTLSRGDVLDLPALERVMEANRVDRIVHTAALLPGALARDPREGVRVNVEGTFNVLVAAKLHDVKRVVYTSSIGVYDRDANVKRFDEDGPLKPSTIYGATKLAGEYLGASYAKTHGLDFKSVRFANVIGPYSGPSYNSSGEFLKGLLEAGLRGQDIVIESPPPMVRSAEWSHSKDAALGAFLLANSKKAKSPVFNIGTGKNTSLKELASYLSELFPAARIKLNSPDAPRVPPLNIERAEKELGYRPRYDVRSSLREMRDWYESLSKVSRTGPADET